MQYRPMSLGLLANELADETDDARRWRLVREFLEEFRHAAPESQAALLTEEPATVNARWDALLAALAEHLAFHHDLGCPTWVEGRNRFLHQAWFFTTLPAGRAAAMETSPASFRRRGVFLDRSDLETA